MRRIGITVIALSFAPLAASMEPGPGQAACQFDGDNNCRIAWDLSAEPRTRYRVQRYDPISRVWLTEQQSTLPFGVGEHPAAPGHLYRVLGCNDDAAASCVSTTVYWAPVLPESADEIPAVVRDSTGNAMGVSKRTRLQTQLLQYNVYLFVQKFEIDDVKGLPEMTEPPAVPDNLLDAVHSNVYPNYEGYRDMALGLAQEPGPHE